MASGMAQGVGFSMAGRMMDSVMGPRQMEVVHTQEGDPNASGASGGEAQQTESSGGGGDRPDTGAAAWTIAAGTRVA